MKAIVIGASRGLGAEFVSQLPNLNYEVLGTSRSELEVTNSDHISSFASTLEDGSLDLVVHNAGIYGPLSPLAKEGWLETFKVNTIAPIEVAYALSSKLKPGSKYVALTSKMGSIADNKKGGSIPYRSSKAALNAAWKSLSYEFLERDVTCALLHPGWVVTDMGGPNALISAKESVSGMLDVVRKLTKEDAGSFFDYQGKVVPW